MLELRNISFEVPKENGKKEIIRNVSLMIDENKFVVIIGECFMFYNAKNDVLEYENTTVDYISFGEGKEDLIFIPGLGEGLNSINGFAVPFSLMYKIYAKDFRYGL